MPQKSLNPISKDSLEILDYHLKIYGSNDFRDKITHLTKFTDDQYSQSRL